MPYKHGAYGDPQPSKGLSPVKSLGTLPVYFGRAPVHQLADYSGKVNAPVLVYNFSDAVSKLGYSDGNWSDYDLCEAIYAHFKNSIQIIGPIVVVNVLDPDAMKTANQSASVTLTNNQGYINNDKVILKSVAISGKTKGTDFTAEYIEDGSKVLIKALTAITSPVTVNFDIVTPNSVTKTQVIGGTNSSTGAKTGIDVVGMVYPTHFMVPTILDAPGWSHIPEVDAALKAATQKINGHWYAWVNSNLVSDTNADTASEAKDWKVSNSYVGSNESPCWPMAKNGSRLFHLSTLATVTMQWVDYNNDGIPFETPSNKQIDITGLCIADGTAIVFDQATANDLNSKGIRTAIFWGGRWVLWGSHTGAYTYGATMDARDKFDCNVRMLYFILNDFQAKYSAEVDKPMNRSKIDTILNDYQQYLDSLIVQGALTYAKIEFTETDNPISDLVEGDFDFNIDMTNSPPAKSLTAKVAYTTKGLEAFYGGDQA